MVATKSLAQLATDVIRFFLVSKFSLHAIGEEGFPLTLTLQ